MAGPAVASNTRQKAASRTMLSSVLKKRIIVILYRRPDEPSPACTSASRCQPDARQPGGPGGYSERREPNGRRRRNCGTDRAFRVRQILPADGGGGTGEGYR